MVATGIEREAYRGDKWDWKKGDTKVRTVTRRRGIPSGKIGQKVG